jgi:DUF1365 family protein
MVEDGILQATIRHKRLFPKENAFAYRAFYVHLNMHNLYQKTSSWIFGRNKKRLMSYQEKDHGLRDGSDASSWAMGVLKDHRITFDGLSLLAMPRVCGYLFNPVSFWFAYQEEALVAVLTEVNNTFGETHSYLCKPSQDQVITKAVWFEADKLFHVSPFMDRTGYYRFNFNWEGEHKKVLIHYHDEGRLKLVTSIEGTQVPMTKTGLLKRFLGVPFLTFKVVALINYQALKIWMKKIKYRPKPKQLEKKLSVAKRSVTKN